jgi:hypothetical protein
MSSVAEQLVEAVRVALYDEIPAVGVRVFRAREDGIPREECPAIVVHELFEEVTPTGISGAVSQVRATVEVRIYVLASSTLPWVSVADEIAVAAHPLIMAVTIAGRQVVVRLQSRQWEGDSSDGSPGVVTMTYDISYFIESAAIDQAA